MVKKQLVNLIQNHQWPHAVIIDSEDQTDSITVAQDIGRILACPSQSSPSDNCPTCQRYSKKALTNLICLESGFKPLKKEELLAAIQQFSLFSLEPQQPKILLINGGENLSPATGNSLLKFLEEPPHNTFVIITSQNYPRIMATIRSRCQRFHLANPTKNNGDCWLAKIIKSNDYQEFIELSYQWSNLSSEELINDLNLAYRTLMITRYPQLASATLTLIDDLKKSPSPSLAVTNYLVILESLMEKKYENL